MNRLFRNLFRPARRPARRASLRLEILEGREVPATLVNPTTVTYQDFDGDDVKVVLSKPIFTAGNVNSIFTFDTSNVGGSNAMKQQLRAINLTGLASAKGTNVTVTAKHSAANGGDGLAAVGQVVASGLDLGAVNITGDLGRIIVGTGSANVAVSSLTVNSMGLYGLSTGALDLNSNFGGKVTTLTVKGDVLACYLNEYVSGGGFGTVTIGGSLTGGVMPSSGSLTAAGPVGSITIKGDLVGGAGPNSGQLLGVNKVGPITIGGSLRGGDGLDSGSISTQGDCGKLTIGGSLVGGTGANSGRIASAAKLTGVTIGGALTGGDGSGSGCVYAQFDVGPVSVKGDVTGGAGSASAIIVSGSAKLGNVTIGGSLRGGTGTASASIFNDAILTADIGKVTIGGDVVGNAPGSAAIHTSGKLAGVAVGGSIFGGMGDNSGQIKSKGDMGLVTVSGDLAGGSGANTGEIYSGGRLAGATVSGSLRGGTGDSSGLIDSQGDLGLVTIKHDVVGGGNAFSGVVQSGIGKIGTVTIGGSLIGGTGQESGCILASNVLHMLSVGGDVVGGSGGGSGEIYAGVRLDTLKIGGSLRGGPSLNSGLVNAVTMTSATIGGDIVGGSASGNMVASNSGLVHAWHLGTLTVGGSVIAGVDTTTGTFRNSGAIRASNDLGTVTIKGSLVGNATNPVIISASGIGPMGEEDIAIVSLIVGGHVEHAQILAGVNAIGNEINADAQIGSINVAGDWISSSIAAGAHPGFGPNFGTALDTKMMGAMVQDLPTASSRIGSVTIGGQARGTFGMIDFYGLVAESVGSLRIAGFSYGLKTGAHNDILNLGLTGDFYLREI